MHYELWDRTSRNLIESFDTRGELLAALREMSSYEGLTVGLRGKHGQTKWMPALDFAVIVGGHPEP